MGVLGVLRGLGFIESQGFGGGREGGGGGGVKIY